MTMERVVSVRTPAPVLTSTIQGEAIFASPKMHSTPRLV